MPISAPQGQSCPFTGATLNTQLQALQEGSDSSGDTHLLFRLCLVSEQAALPEVTHRN